WIWDGHRGADECRPTERAGVRERPRRGGGARRRTRRSHLRARLSPAAGGGGASNEANADARLPPRRFDRDRHADLEAALGRGSRAGRGRSRLTVYAGQTEVLDEIRAADKVFLTTHENPDGDAL